MGYAAQWLDGLRVLVEKHTDCLLEQADTYLQEQISLTSAIPPPPFNPDLSKATNIQPALHIPLALDPHPPRSEQPAVPPTSSPPAAFPEECMRELRQLCPACFGGSKHGRPIYRPPPAGGAIIATSLLGLKIGMQVVPFNAKCLGKKLDRNSEALTCYLHNTFEGLSLLLH